MKKIGIDARLFENPTGIGRYLRNLIHNLEKIDNENHYVIFLSKKGSDMYHPNNANFKKWIVDVPVYSALEQLVLPVEFSRAGLDLMHFPHFNVPIMYPGKFIVTIHDLTHNKTEQEGTTKSSSEKTIKQFGYKMVLSVSTKRAETIIVPSNSIKSEIIKNLYYASDDKVEVTYEGVDYNLKNLVPKNESTMRTRLEEMNVTEKYMLYVGSAYPHKNLNNLIISFRDVLKATELRLQLVIAGQVDKFSQRLAGFVHALKMDRYVIFASKYAGSSAKYVSDADIAYLYKNASFYVFPSYNEGFSITPLEAQAFGLPVLLSDIPTHREVFKDSALYFNPESNIDITDKIILMASNENLREQLSTVGELNAARYSWEHMARKTLNIYLASL